MRPLSIAILGAVVLALSASISFGADTDWAAPAGSRSDKLAVARERIANEDWAGAVTELRRVGDFHSAEWNNLMGYTLRHQGPPDLDAAEHHYNEALRIDPHHFGALEYSGELYLMKNDLPKAERRLQMLGNSCELACAEYRQLSIAINQYKAAGNRYVPVKNGGRTTLK